MHARSVGVGVRSVVMRPSASTRTTVSTAVTASTTSRVPVVCKQWPCDVVTLPANKERDGPNTRLLRAACYMGILGATATPALAAAAAATTGMASDAAGAAGGAAEAATAAAAEVVQLSSAMMGSVPLDSMTALVDLAMAQPVLLPLVMVYLTATPGVGAAAFDMLVSSPIDLVTQKRITADNVAVQARLGDGSFGTVYTGRLNDKLPVVVKRAKQVAGAASSTVAEEWMNRRVRRSASMRAVAAPYVGSYEDDGLRATDSKVLLWELKGELTLEQAMGLKDFPLCLEEQLFGKEGKGNVEQRQTRVVRRIVSQVLDALKRLHSTGIVHRDVKPANLVLMGNRFRLIDFGAATDLRVGINYDPELSLLDPGYCPPEQYVMPESTPRPPVAAAALALSPFLWGLNRPDLFDTYSVGIILLQLSVPNLRQKSGMAATGLFQRNLLNADYDLQRWRDEFASGAWDFSILDAEGGKGWDLACKLVCKRNSLQRGRLGAAAAALHPFALFG